MKNDVTTTVIAGLIGVYSIVAVATITLMVGATL